MLASFFEGIKAHDQLEMGKKIYKRGYWRLFWAFIVAFTAIRGDPDHDINWHGLPYICAYEAVDITSELAFH